jgi:hypothetical protein
MHNIGEKVGRLTESKYRLQVYTLLSCTFKAFISLRLHGIKCPVANIGQIVLKVELLYVDVAPHTPVRSGVLSSKNLHVELCISTHKDARFYSPNDTIG